MCVYMGTCVCVCVHVCMWMCVCGCGYVWMYVYHYVLWFMLLPHQWTYPFIWHHLHTHTHTHRHSDNQGEQSPGDEEDPLPAVISSSPPCPKGGPQESEEDPDVDTLRELLQQEESRLEMLKQIRGLQDGSPKVTVAPGNQRPAGTPRMGISSRLQQLVDTVAVEQSLNHTGIQSKQRQLKSPANPKEPSSTKTEFVETSSLITQTISQIRTSLGGSKVPSIRPKTALPHESSANDAKQSSVIVASRKGQVFSGGQAVNGGGGGSIDLSVENSKRYKDYLFKETHVRQSFRKKMEKKILAAPYPKTFRQVWPVIPVYDPLFIRNFGLEAILLHFDEKMRSAQKTTQLKVKPVCNQCSCDYASAWQVRKSNSKQLLLCEACDFANLKILQRSKLSGQLKELVDSIKKEEAKFDSECDEARKQVQQLEKACGAQRAAAAAGGVVSSSQTTGQPTAPVAAVGLGKSGGAAAVPEVIVIGDQSSPALDAAGQQRSKVTVVEGSRKRKGDPVAVVSSPAPPPSKAMKPGSALDQTLEKLTQHLLKKKLDEHLGEPKQQESDSGGEAGKMADSGMSGDNRRSRRKGTPKHKRHLSSSGPGDQA